MSRRGALAPVADLDAAVREDATGAVLIDIEVTPGAKGGDRFPAGFNVWRGRVAARVAAPPVGGEANAAVVDLVARFLGVTPGRVVLVSGATDRRKTVRVEGLPRAAAVARLREAIR